MEGGLCVEPSESTALVDYMEGARRFGGDEALFRKYLGKFLSAPEYGALCAAMDQGRRADAFALAHTLKGNAGNLSLTALYARASELTEALRDEATVPQAEKLLPQLKLAYRETVAELERFLA